MISDLSVYSLVVFIRQGIVVLAKTALHAHHLALNAKMVDFHGWELPLHYGSQLTEHHAVRQSAGVFDVSHMTIVDTLGAGGRQFLRHLLCNDIDQLPRFGHGLYSCMCNERGGIIDDLIAYQRAPDNYRLVFNAATKTRVLSWLRDKMPGFAVGLQERQELAMLALQGPRAREYLTTMVPPATAESLAALAPFACMEHDTWFIARTGYTGEDGFELILPQEQVGAVWDQLIQAGVQPCGLGARDTLRLEAGLLLSGQDMDETTSPLESALAWTIQWEPIQRDFIGMDALRLQQQQGLTRRLVGLSLLENSIMRQGLTVLANDHPVGVITSGSFSPTLGHSIALARLATPVPTALQIEIRGKCYPVRCGKTRFIPRKRS